MKIAIVRLSALGDIIQSAIVLQFIKNFNKNIEIHWFVDEKFKEILEDHPLIDELYPLSLKEKKLFKSLKILFKARKNNYNAVLDLQGLIKSGLVSRILSRNTFGFDKNSLKESFADNFYNQKFNMSYDENVYVRYLSLASFALNMPFEVQDIFFKQDVFYCDENLKKSLYKKLDFKKTNILIHTGSSVPNKIYPKEKLAKLCSLLCKDKNVKIFLSWGDEKEKEFALKVLEQSDENQQIELLEKLNLKELIALSKIVDLIIGNDSGPTHLAFALNKASITIFAPTPAKRNAFKTSINKTISIKGKNINAKHINKKDFSIANIDENEIYILAKGLLDAKQR